MNALIISPAASAPSTVSDAGRRDFCGTEFADALTAAEAGPKGREAQFADRVADQASTTPEATNVGTGTPDIVGTAGDPGESVDAAEGPKTAVDEGAQAEGAEGLMPHMLPPDHQQDSAAFRLRMRGTAEGGDPTKPGVPAIDPSGTSDVATGAQQAASAGRSSLADQVAAPATGAPIAGNAGVEVSPDGVAMTAGTTGGGIAGSVPPGSVEDQTTAPAAGASQVILGESADSQAADGQIVHGQATDGQIANGRATDRKIANGQATDGQIANEQATDGQIANEQATDGQFTDGQISHEQATDGQFTNGQITKDQPTDGGTDLGRGPTTEDPGNGARDPGPGTSTGTRPPDSTSQGSDTDAVAATPAPDPADERAAATVVRTAGPEAPEQSGQSSPRTAPIASTDEAVITAPVSQSQARRAAVATPPAAQLASAVAALRRQGDGQYNASIDLHPSELGRVQVQMEIRAGVVNLSVLAEQSGTRTMLAQQLDDLRASLQQAGLEAGALDVSNQAWSDAQRQRDQAAADSGGDGTPGSLSPGSGAEGPVEPPRTRATSSTSTDAGLDVRL